MIRFCRNVIEAAREDHRARRALVWECVALQHQLAVLKRSGTRRPRFRPIDRLFWGVYVVLAAGLARRTKSHSTRNRPALAPSRYRSDLEIAISWSLARWTPADRPRDPPTDPRDGSREFSSGGTTHPRRAAETRHHGLAGHSIAIYADVAKRPPLTGMANIDYHCPKRQFQRAQSGP
jgi:hypothetical protein